jgi:FixJ family two-component response regulator
VTDYKQSAIYVTDNDASIRDALEDLLRSVDLMVKTFGSTRDFLASERSDAPGGMVLDVRLPGTGGLEFQPALIDSGMHLPMIFIGGHGDSQMSVQAMKSGTVDSLTRPLHEQALLDAIQTALERDRKSPESPDQRRLPREQ